jgi:hypothetical protein
MVLPSNSACLVPNTRSGFQKKRSETALLVFQGIQSTRDCRCLSARRESITGQPLVRGRASTHPRKSDPGYSPFPLVTRSQFQELPCDGVQLEQFGAVVARHSGHNPGGREHACTKATRAKPETKAVTIPIRKAVLVNSPSTKAARRVPHRNSRAGTKSDNGQRSKS